MFTGQAGDDRVRLQRESGRLRHHDLQQEPTDQSLRACRLSKDVIGEFSLINVVCQKWLRPYQICNRVAVMWVQLRQKAGCLERQLRPRSVTATGERVMW